MHGKRGISNNYSVEAFVPNACFSGIPVLAAASTATVAAIRRESGWWDGI